MKVTQRRKGSVKVRNSVLFASIIRMAFGNEVSSATKLISSLERTTCTLFSKQVLFRMFFQCELQKIYLNRDRAGKIS